MWSSFFSTLYIALVVLIALFGLNSLFLTVAFLPHFRSLRKKSQPEPASDPDDLPVVAVHLPLYNEKYVAERLIDAVCAFDYPIQRMIIQVLDDSTDETTEGVARRVAHYQARGYQIELLHRDNRQGYKAGALAEALEKTHADLVAVFDADFLPPADFLRRTVPYFQQDARLGMVQGRWGHLNHDYNPLTRAESIFLDGHVIVEQVARSRSGLLFNFNGSGGIWRVDCIRDSGGWQWDTLSEDIDLSYRAQLCGWRLQFLPDLVVPAEVPPTISAFKKQQYRWSFGVVQVFVKTIRRLWTAKNLNFFQRVAGTFHLGTNLMHPVGLLLFLISVPLAMWNPNMPSALGWLSIATSGPSIMFAVAQLVGYKDGPRRLLALPLLVLLGVGLAISNVKAVLLALAGKQAEFTRTPKYRIESKKDGWKSRSDTFKLDPTVYGELFMAFYMAVGLGIAIERAPGMIPLMVLGMLSFGSVSAMGLMEARKPKKKAEKAASQVEVA